MTGVKENEKGWGVGGPHRGGESLGSDDCAFMGLILFLLKTMSCSLLCPEKWTTWGRNLVMPSRRSLVVAAGRTSSSM